MDLELTARTDLVAGGGSGIGDPDVLVHAVRGRGWGDASSWSSEPGVGVEEATTGFLSSEDASFVDGSDHRVDSRSLATI